MKLTNEEIKRLKDAGYLHDIGKIVLSKDTISNGEDISEQEKKKLKLHSVVGYRILNSFDDTLDLAESVLSHHEYWDGSGYPKGLKGEEIPKLARIISVAESFDSLTNHMNKNVISNRKLLKFTKYICHYSLRISKKKNLLFSQGNVSMHLLFG